MTIILLTTTSTNLAKLIISLSVIKIFDNLFWSLRLSVLLNWYVEVINSFYLLINNCSIWKDHCQIFSFKINTISIKFFIQIDLIILILIYFDGFSNYSWYWRTNWWYHSYNHCHGCWTQGCILISNWKKIMLPSWSRGIKSQLSSEIFFSLPWKTFFMI